MTHEESLDAFIRQVRLVIADAWPEGGTMYVSPCEKKEVACPDQEPGWPFLQLSIKPSATQQEPQPERSPSMQFHQAQLL